MRRAALGIGVLAVVLGVVLANGSAMARQAAQKASNPDNLPPLSYVCTMAGDEDVLEDKPGKCRKCGMALVPIRLDSVWTCPIHAAITRDKPGKCPLDGRDLVQMTMAVSWACPGSDNAALTPGTCANGTPMERRYPPRPHGNHNPQHGGAFFMAPDNWHHLEGAYFAPGVFRLYLYDDYTKPLPLAQVRATAARLILNGTEIPLVRNGRILDAKVGKLAFPATMQAKVKFQPAAPEHHFDFIFEKYSKDAPAPVVTTTATSPAATTAPAPPSATAPSTTLSPPLLEVAPSSVDAALIPLPVPETVPEMLAQLRTRNDQIKMF